MFSPSISVYSSVSFHQSFTLSSSICCSYQQDKRTTPGSLPTRISQSQIGEHWIENRSHVYCFLRPALASQRTTSRQQHSIHGLRIWPQAPEGAHCRNEGMTECQLVANLTVESMQQNSDTKFRRGTCGVDFCTNFTCSQISFYLLIFTFFLTFLFYLFFLLSFALFRKYL